MIEGKNEEMSTSELSGGARIHYIFQSIFVKSLEVRLHLCIYRCINAVLFA
ncbi:putative Dynamin superfamily [Helianthus annuus]|nr:putative Dynamin superfamily [Helianthus annuus]